MDTYNVQAIVKNGQLIIDLPTEFDNTEVEILISRLDTKSVSKDESKTYSTGSEDRTILQEPDVLAYEKPSVMQSDFILPRQKIDLSTLYGSISNETAELWRQNIEDAYESDFWESRPNVDFKQFRGALKIDMTIDEIDSLTKSWHNEWNRDIS